MLIVDFLALARLKDQRQLQNKVGKESIK